MSLVGPGLLAGVDGLPRTCEDEPGRSSSLQQHAVSAPHLRG